MEYSVVFLEITCSIKINNKKLKSNIAKLKLVRLYDKQYCAVYWLYATPYRLITMSSIAAANSSSQLAAPPTSSL